MLVLREIPASYGLGEIFRVLVLAEGDLGLDTKHAAVGSHEKRLDVAAIFAIVNLRDLLPDGTIFDFFSEAFEDYGFVGFFSANDNSRICSDVLCFAGTRAGAEPEGVLPPDSPDDHEMRMAIGASRGDPVVVRFFDALKSPGPGL